jgi:hypothetical protein
MGRYANALDWTSPLPERTESEIRLRERPPLEEVGDDDADEPTRPFDRLPVPAAAVSASGVVRLSALADQMDGERTSGVVVRLVRAFLDDLRDVRVALGALLAATSDAPASPGLDAAVRSLAHSIGMWRTNMVEHVDDLALSEHRSLSGWSSLPEYSSAYTLAFLRPALAEAWANAAGCAAFVEAVGASIERLNATLRATIDGDRGDGPSSVDWIDGALALSAW